ncbi:restriction endonuclease subunit S [Bacteroides fragilis]|uniref:Type I restriction modification DNA specificity domain protein n=2 Tax=Bacteroides fragilis TaxID=817 RepID=A0A016EAU0_BACFG|nr:restriction endonuclease subunit S [Bacteroides fragilis]EXZ74186.1 type I restriction modification DNA specificity domain protein [Bacteroides fragilis str. 3976T8]KAA5088531.1 restriction endonuclease subunit S [Bacteroides fragilis]KAA5129437.1 restriction endonuclease subunit S [Bacteroides fragilis]KAA5177984.1 restriction endonuclease subunit S [Bacteroides fragilis]KAA5190929.1 restriction endonuclease subunit S [Bacteroides fragilis]
MNGKQLKNSILQWAIQGKLVQQDPNDEPASVLLEHIREEKAKLVKEKKIKKDKNESIIYRGDDNSYYEKFIATGEVKCIDEEIPFEIPQGWEWTRIGNIFNHTSGKQQSSSNKNSGTPQKFITTSNLYWGYFVLDNVKIMNFTEEEIRTCSATKGDLLVCEGGAGYGRSAIWNEDYDICLQNHVHRLRPCISGICEYVYHFIYLLKESNNLASVGTAMPGLSANRLKGLLLPLPPLSEQRRIVAKLGELLPQVEKYSKVQSYLDELNVSINDKLKKSILQEAIQGKLVPQITREGTAQELLEQIRQEKQRLTKEGKLKKSALTDSVIYKGDDNKYYERVGGKNICIDDEILFEIPDSWVWCRLGFLFNHNTGKALNASNKEGSMLPYITTSNLYWGQFDLSSVRQMYFKDSEIEKCSVSNGDLLVCEGGDIGRAAIWPYDTPMCIQNHIHKLRSYNQLDTLFYYYIFQAYKYNGYIGGKGIGIQGLSSKALHNMLVPLPPINEQIRITSKISSLFQFI